MSLKAVFEFTPDDDCAFEERPVSYVLKHTQMSDNAGESAARFKHQVRIPNRATKLLSALTTSP
jgi:hypothetical protein